MAKIHEVAYTEKTADAIGAKKNLKGSLPKTWGVLYVHPNPDGSRKKCDNCMMFISGEKQCEIHDVNIAVTKDMTCGYHVYGKVHAKRMHQPDGEHLDAVDPKHSGLAEVKGGTSCNICEYYRKIDDGKGTCLVVQVGVGESGSAGKLATVEALGCCARWEKK